MWAWLRRLPLFRLHLVSRSSSYIYMIHAPVHHAGSMCTRFARKSEVSVEPLFSRRVLRAKIVSPQR